MKKTVLVLLVLLAAGAAVVHYFPEKAGPYIAGTPLEKLAGTSTPVYQWRDENGQWQVTDEPPPEGTPYEVKQYALDANLVPAFKREQD